MLGVILLLTTISAGASVIFGVLIYRKVQKKDIWSPELGRVRRKITQQVPDKPK